MPNTNLIVALVFAAVFGAVLVWFAFYCIYRYFRRGCLELRHWFRLVTPPHWRSPCHSCDGTGRVVVTGEKSRSRSRRREKSRERGERTWARGYERDMHIRGQRAIESGTEWHGQQPMQRPRPRPALQASPAMQRHGTEEQYDSWAGWQGQAPGDQQMGMTYPQPAMYPGAYPQIFPQMYPQAAPQASPFMMSPAIHQQHAPQMAIPVPESVSSMPTYPKRTRDAYTEQSEERQPKTPRAKSKPAADRVPKLRKTDYIHFVDQYPPMVEEAIKRDEAIRRAAQQASSSSSDSSTSTEPVEEVPRASIPRAPSRFAGSMPFQFPQHPRLTTRMWDAPRSYPRQWTGNAGGGAMPTEQARYAPPYMSPEIWREKNRGAEPLHQAPSNTLPILLPRRM
jgi:hypothetical protein